MTFTSAKSTATKAAQAAPADQAEASAGALEAKRRELEVELKQIKQKLEGFVDPKTVRHPVLRCDLAREVFVQQAGPALQQRVPADQRETVANEIQADLRKYVDETTPLVRDRAIKLAPSTIGAILADFVSRNDEFTALAKLVAAHVAHDTSLDGIAEWRKDAQVDRAQLAQQESRLRALRAELAGLDTAPRPAGQGIGTREPGKRAPGPGNPRSRDPRVADRRRIEESCYPKSKNPGKSGF